MSFYIQHGLFKFDVIDYYAILGVPLNSKVSEVRKKYIKIAQCLHPDTCKAKNKDEKKQASQVLSKLVNPAYQKLSKEKNRKEYQLVVSKVAKRIAEEGTKFTLASDPAKELFKANRNNLDLVYEKLLQPLAAEQYKSLEEVSYKTSQISELNLVYLIIKEGKQVKKNRQKPVKTTTAAAPKKVEAKQKTTDKEEKKKSLVDSFLRRGQGYIDKSNFAKAILELREGLKIDPNHSTCHGLLALAYLKQNQMGMAKIHTNKALALNPKEPTAIKLKQQLVKKPEKKSEKKSKGGSMFAGLFGGKKSK